VLIYRQPSQDYTTSSDVVFYTNIGSDPTQTSITTCVMEAPPSTTSEALLLTSSRQWDAKEGCYVIPSLHSQHLPTNLGNFCQYAYYRDTPGDTTFYAPNLIAVPSLASTFFIGQ